MSITRSWLLRENENIPTTVLLALSFVVYFVVFENGQVSARTAYKIRSYRGTKTVTVYVPSAHRTSCSYCERELSVISLFVSYTPMH